MESRRRQAAEAYVAMIRRDRIPKALVALRTKRGVDRAKVAQEIGAAEKTIQRIESGKFAPRLETLVALADYFGVSLDVVTGRIPVDDATFVPSVLSDFDEAYDEMHAAAEYALANGGKAAQLTLPATTVVETEEYVLVPASRLDDLDKKLREVSKRLDEALAGDAPSLKSRRRASRSA